MMILVILISGITMLLLSAVQSWLTGELSASKRRIFSLKAMLVQKKVVATIENDEAWQLTRDHPDNAGMFGCLSTNNCPAGARRFALYDSRGQKLLDSRIESEGLDVSGIPCIIPGAGAGGGGVEAERCVFRFDLQWEPDCTGCARQRARVLGDFETLSRMSLNLSRYRIDFVRGGAAGSLSESCRAMKGEIDQADHNSCILAVVGEACSNGAALIGVDPATGLKICRTMPAIGSPCTGGRGVIGFAQNGKLLCAN
ncbi:MAG: hypothetical protein NDJ89_03920 [Oligoflexia bacterium]|nr:hypothetical protein [Oligoflexia bacterium]